MSAPEPMASALNAAIAAARHSSCQKSKRGAAIFHPFTGLIVAASNNGRPGGICDDRCQPRAITVSAPIIPYAQSRCSMLAVHAETRAIRWGVAKVASDEGDLSLKDCELVHVKVSDLGDLVPSGGPSCWQCAREVLDVGLLGVWLFEEDEFDPTRWFPGHWTFYPTPKFYVRTLQACGLDA